MELYVLYLLDKQGKLMDDYPAKIETTQSQSILF